MYNNITDYMGSLDNMVHLKTGPEIPLFYAGRSIFITGGSGFIGKVLIERLLTTCPDISKLYLLMREKKGVTPEKRLLQLKQCQVFDVLREANPKQLEKIEVVAGDVTRPQLGLSVTSRAQLRNVSVVFHSAATVKLQEEFKCSVDQNLRPVMAVLEFCDTLPNIEAFIHVSTAYSNAELNHVEEKVYPPPMDMDSLLRLADDHKVDEEESRKYTASKPNTYTFTKAMAEHVVDRHGCCNYPIAIFRPSIVISSLRHPFPGWIDNLNGPSGVIAGTSSGLLRVFRVRSDARADMIPVDVVVDTLIAVAWETAVDRLPHVRVYNCTTCGNPTTWSTFHKVLNTSVPDYPSSHAIMYPHIHATANKFAYKALEIMLQTIPLHLLEYVRRLLCINTHVNLIKANMKLQAMSQALEFFALREWRFDNENVVRLMNRLSTEDRRLFNLDVQSINWEGLLTNLVKGTRKYVLKEHDHQLLKARTRIRKLGFIYTMIKLICTIFVLKFTMHYASLQNLIHGTFLFIKQNSY